MTPKEANDSLLAIIQNHIMSLQTGEFGDATLEDLEFCCKLHALIENPKDEIKIGSWDREPDESTIKIAIHDCYCGEIKKGDKYYDNTCDLGCAYPGA